MSMTIYDIISIFHFCIGVFFCYNFHLYSHFSTSRLYASAPSTYSVLISSNESLGDRITPSLPNLLNGALIEYFAEHFNAFFGEVHFGDIALITAKTWVAE